MTNETYTTVLQRRGKQVYIPDSLLKVANIVKGDYLEVTIRKLDTD